MKRFSLRVLPLLLLAGVIVFLSSCDSFLNETGPIGELNEETYYQTEEQVRLAVYDLYTHQLNFYSSNPNGFDGYWAGVIMPSDNVRYYPQSPNDYDNFNWNATDGVWGSYWNNSYSAIGDASVLINQIPESPINEEAKTPLLAETRFIRAYHNFMLARMFGNAPLVRGPVTTIDSANIGNEGQNIASLYDFIEQDLRFAKDNLPATRDEQFKGRVTSGTAAAYLGKVNLFRAQRLGDDSQYGEAISAFEEVINAGNHSLVPRYADNFERSTENNEESLYEIQNAAGTFGEQGFNSWLSPNSFIGADKTTRNWYMRAGGGEPGDGLEAPANKGGADQFHITQAMQSEFEPHDPRRFETYYVPGEVYSRTLGCDIPSGDGTRFVKPCIYQEEFTFTGSTPAKYLRPFAEPDPPPAPNSRNNERILRYADVLLMLAEAELLGNGNNARAADLVNQVRARARDDFSTVCSNSAVGLGCPDSTESAPDNILPPISAGEIAHADIRHERNVELALEGKRYEDLVRWHMADDVNFSIGEDVNFAGSSNSWTETNLLRPIPQEEIDINPNLVQNEGY
jgi:hypothetical protein